MQDDTFSTDSGIVKLHPTKGTHLILLFTEGASRVDEYYFDTYGFPPPKNFESQIEKGTYSDYRIQKDDSCCAPCCLYVLNLTQVLGSKNAVLNLYYQIFKPNAKRFA